ncbi:ABC transporter ATP-binding protein [Rarobacter faecitabidus]|uniref:ABC-type multidrug transport system fused ATPase/permease subunit n=1 Tax=Rarobacter faecitabidus TaxID=13243 RepID=A0A542ZU61_RARFA|nr:ABC transporter ATP-binding protein [Rarobacter faecitabidus]TQL63882.1 ABC-type multidrug transport system fused ATPase/permease subunit [Rarobacter faecitabidus]
MTLLWTTLRQLLPLFPPGARRFFVGYVAATSALTVMDVGAMALLALIISPIVAGSDVISIPLAGSLPASSAPWLVLAACGLIILKSALSVLLHWLATRRFARYELEIGRRLFSAYIHSSWEQRSKRSVAEITRIADGAIGNAIMGFVLPISLIPSYVLTFLMILAVLLVAQPVTALIALVYLGSVSLFVNRIVTRRSMEAGRVNRDSSYRVANFMTQMVEALKEITLRGRLDEVAQVVTDERKRAVRARANASFLSVVPKFVFDSALIGGFVLIGVSAYLLGGMQQAIVAVALFAATGFRLIPAINGVQASIVQATATLPSAQDVISDIHDSERDIAQNEPEADVSQLPTDPGTLALRDVTFRYPGATDDVLRGVELDIPFGSSLGIVGPSGAGKSTLVDLLLGLSVPSRGEILIDGHPLIEVLRAWRSRVGYVPQRVSLFNGTIAQNVALTWTHDYDRDRVARALEMAQLMTMIAERPQGIDAMIGERGMALSGGEQQRLGIARALYADPLVLVLDEATSSLDTKTEDSVTRAIKSLQGEMTIISVAHRLSTIKDYDRIAYVSGGKILGHDTFRLLARKVPQFGEQVALAGLGEEL